ncbi:MAG TPA: hypothetical protein VJ438_04930 [Candidatus Nanoarchaeia archaeon]|nr:hypothetical protein [Candidatus Nanoarchaeia archaeon]
MAKKEGPIDRFIKPFNLFYLGFLASIGLAFGSSLMINVLRTLIEFYFQIEVLTYSRIFFVVFYLFFIRYSYYFLDMKKNTSLRNGFFLFFCLYVLAIIYLWIS